jgi:Fe-S cluster assembly protein SufD
VFALRGRQHADTHLEVRHDARDTVSDVLWRGVADQRARGVFHGAITVAAGADGADANLSNKNLLLSPHAEIDTQPVLEIYADEVKAAHGATVGQLDERAMFYLRSRGIPPETARQLLIAAFCGAALREMPFAGLREHLDAMLASRLPRIGDL